MRAQHNAPNQCNISTLLCKVLLPKPVCRAGPMVCLVLCVVVRVIRVLRVRCLCFTVVVFVSSIRANCKQASFLSCPVQIQQAGCKCQSVWWHLECRFGIYSEAAAACVASATFCPTEESHGDPTLPFRRTTVGEARVVLESARHAGGAWCGAGMGQLAIRLECRCRLFC